MTFGKNRVQYDNSKLWFWNFYRFKEFEVYFNGEKELSVFTAKTAVKEKEDIERSLDYKLDGRIQFFVFNKLSDLRQSNIGLEVDDQYNTGGVTRIVGRKVLLYFDGNHENYRKEIRRGIAQVEINELLFGGDLKDMFQNAAMLNLPEWYITGLNSYFADPWNIEIDNRMRDGFLTGKYRKFNRLTGKDASYAGQSIWKYITEVYGESAIPNIIYLTRINRNVESGFSMVLGLSMKQLIRNWQEHYSKLYSTSDSLRALPEDKPLKRTRKKHIYTQYKLSPDGNHVAFVTNELGKYKLFVYDTEKRRKKKIIKGGYKSIILESDLSFPVTAWHPTGKILSVIRERKGKILLGTYNLETKKYEENPLFNFEKVLDFSYSPDGNNLVISGVNKSVSDIYLYNLRTHTFEQLTKDFFDDFNPRFSPDGKAIVFASNRSLDTLGADKRDTLLPVNTTDLFLYDFSSRSKILKRITETPYTNEIQPIPVNNELISFLSDENGIRNRYIAKLDSTISYIDTTEHYRFFAHTFPVSNYSRNVVSQDIFPSKNKLASLLFFKGKYHLYLRELPKDPYSAIPDHIYNTWYRDNFLLRQTRRDSLSKKDSLIIPKLESIIPDKNVPDEEIKDTLHATDQPPFFQNELPLRKNKKNRSFVEIKRESQDTVAGSAKPSKNEFILPKLRPYFKAFSTNYVVSQLDNNLTNTAYQPFTGAYYNPPLNSFFKVGISDLLEDYRISGGARLSYNLKSNEYFISYEDLKKRLDKQLILYTGAREMNAGKIRTYEGRYLLKWPFSDISAIKGSVALRHDAGVLYSQDYKTLTQPNVYEERGGLRFEYIFDNTINRGLNLYNGTRLKFFAEYFKQLNVAKTNMYVLGLDARNYLRVHRQIIWANRIAASTSLGDEKIIYYLGGVDNEIITGPKFDRSTYIDYSQNYAYQALATNMRGFDQNIRNGNSFAVINSELRVPLFSYIIQRPIKSDFFRNFQVVGFGDLGSAWVGLTPNAEENSFNRQTIEAGPMTITLKTRRDPIIAGYGWGLRSRLFGYFVRADWAWGYAEGVRRPRVFYLSFSLDF